ncbi:hypothetical protein Tco_0461362 [Tanacetum coccineum]
MNSFILMIYFVFKHDSYTSDESVHSKPSVGDLYVVKDDAFMIDKKYENVTDVKLVFDETMLISNSDVLEQQEHANLVVGVNANKDVDGSETKTIVGVDFVLSAKIFVSDEDVEFALKNVTVSNDTILSHPAKAETRCATAHSTSYMI